MPLSKMMRNLIDLVCILLVLMSLPRLFYHVLIYFSPLFISTVLFVASLISLKPHLEETTTEQYSGGLFMARENAVESQQNEEHSQCNSCCGVTLAESKEELSVDCENMAEGIDISWADSHLIENESKNEFSELSAVLRSQTTDAVGIELLREQDQDQENRYSETLMAAVKDLYSPSNLIHRDKACLRISSHETRLETIPEEESPSKDSSVDVENNPDAAVEDCLKATILFHNRYQKSSH